METMAAAPIVDPCWRTSINASTTEALALLLEEKPRRIDVNAVVGVVRGCVATCVVLRCSPWVVTRVQQVGYGTNKFSPVGLATLDKKVAHVRLLFENGASVNGRCYVSDILAHTQRQCEIDAAVNSLATPARCGSSPPCRWRFTMSHQNWSICACAGAPIHLR